MGRVVTSLEVRFGSQSVAVSLDADGQVRVGDARFAVEPIRDGVYRVSDDARHWTVAVAATGDERWIFVDGQVHQLEIGSVDSRRRKSGAAGHELSSPMPATVVKILVEPGATVSRGDSLMMLEAMKMELSIRAPRDGVVSAIHCKAGDLIAPGVNLLDLA